MKTPLLPSRTAGSRWVVLRELVMEPFAIMPSPSLTLSVADQLVYRRRLLLQLILFTLGIIQILVLAGIAIYLIVNHINLTAPPPNIGTTSTNTPLPPPIHGGLGMPPPFQRLTPSSFSVAAIVPLEPILLMSIWLLLTVIAWIINRRSRTFVASLVYTYGMVLLMGAGFIVLSINQAQLTILYAFVSMVLIVLSGLILAPAYVWLTSFISIVLLTVTSIMYPHPTPALLSDQLLVILMLMLTVLTWIFVRIAGANLQSLTLILEREHELAQLKEQFIVSANHELRTPIMAMYGSLELLQTFATTINPDQQRQIVDRGMRAGHVVQQMLSTLIELTAAESDQFTYTIEPIQLREHIQSILEFFDPREIGESASLAIIQQERRVDINIPAHITVLADSRRLRQIVLNLLTNALKYSEAGSPISINAFVRKDHSVEISIIDLGLGIPHDQAKQLFQRFSRLKRDIASTVRGTGVGLYFCKIVVEAMGGTIWVTSSGIAGEGSTFSFTLPLYEPDTNDSSLVTTQPRVSILLSQEE